MHASTHESISHSPLVGRKPVQKKEKKKKKETERIVAYRGGYHPGFDSKFKMLV